MCQSGATDVRAFELPIRRRQGHVLANCRYLANANVAEDLSQEVSFLGLATAFSSLL